MTVHLALLIPFLIQLSASDVLSCSQAVSTCHLPCTCTCLLGSASAVVLADPIMHDGSHMAGKHNNAASLGWRLLSQRGAVICCVVGGNWCEGP